MVPASVFVGLGRTIVLLLSFSFAALVGVLAQDPRLFRKQEILLHHTLE
jgi:hypothetical protein